MPNFLCSFVGLLWILYEPLGLFLRLLPFQFSFQLARAEASTNVPHRLLLCSRGPNPGQFFFMTKIHYITTSCNKPYSRFCLQVTRKWWQNSAMFVYFFWMCVSNWPGVGPNPGQFVAENKTKIESKSKSNQIK